MLTGLSWVGQLQKQVTHPIAYYVAWQSHSKLSGSCRTPGILIRMTHIYAEKTFISTIKTTETSH